MDCCKKDQETATCCKKDSMPGIKEQPQENKAKLWISIFLIVVLLGGFILMLLR